MDITNKFMKGELQKKKQADEKSKVNSPMEEWKCFKWGNIMFEEMENEKIKCGLCQAECVRLVSHLNGRPICSNGINMVEFKISYTK